MPNYNENQNNYGNLNESNENGGFQEFEKRPNGKEKLRLFFNNRRNRAIAAILAVVILASSVCAVVFSKGIGNKKPTLPEETTLPSATAPTSETDSQETKPADTSAPSTEVSTEAPTSEKALPEDEKSTPKGDASSVKPPKSKPTETKPQTTKPHGMDDSQQRHVHKFAPATCISPEKCACGATRGDLSEWHGNNVNGHCAVCNEALFPDSDYFEFYGGESLSYKGVVGKVTDITLEDLRYYPYGGSYVLFNIEITDLSNAVSSEDGMYDFECYVLCYDDNYNQVGAYIVAHDVFAVGDTFTCASSIPPGTCIVEFYSR